jgi:hypothetical protein
MVTLLIWVRLALATCCRRGTFLIGSADGVMGGVGECDDTANDAQYGQANDDKEHVADDVGLLLGGDPERPALGRLTPRRVGLPSGWRLKAFG